MDLAYSSALGPRVRKEYRDGVEQLRILPRRSRKVIGASLLGLLWGTFKGEEGVRHFFGENKFWTAEFAIVVLGGAWLLWLLAFVSEFVGTEIVKVERGELIVSRGIGRLRRVFRYPVRDVRELVATDWLAEEEDKPRGRLHRIFFRPKSGAVRFEDGAKTVYFAETLDEQGGEAIVRWLLPKLPRGAGELVLGLGYGG